MELSALRYAERFNGLSGSAIREIFKLLAVPGMISFAGGNPAASALPDDVVAQISKDVLEKDGKRILQYGATEGYPPLRESLTGYIQSQFGFQAAYDEVLPTTGSTQAMDLLCKALINPGDVILVENPTFLGNMQCMHLYQARLVPLESDEFGLIPEKVEEAIKKHHPKMIYVIPTFQNPTGKTLPLERRAPLAALAEKYGVVIAEDDPYRDLRYAGQALPTIKSFDKSGFVVFMGSFSKVISPGLRLGFLCAPAPLMRKCVIGKQSSDVHTSNLVQAIVCEYLRRDLLHDHLPAICADYSRQLSAMLDELKSFPEGTRYTRPEGGLFVWVELPSGVNATAMLKRCVDRGVAYVPGTHFFADGGHDNTLRLNFSNSPVDKIHEGMAILRDVIAQEIKK